MAFSDSEHSLVEELGFVRVAWNWHWRVWRLICWSWLSHMILSPRRLNIIIKICLIQLFTSRIYLTCICTYPPLSSSPTLQFPLRSILYASLKLVQRIQQTVLLIQLRSRHLFTVHFPCHPAPRSNLYLSQWEWLPNGEAFFPFSIVLHN